MSVKFRLLAVSAVILTAVSCQEQKKDFKVISPVGFSEVKIEDSFWSPRLKNHKDVTVNVCLDQIENKTGRIRNFENAALGSGEHSGIFFDDSDVYKALEGFAYTLQNNPDPVLEAKCDEWIDKIAAAQQEDGYINTYYTLTGMENRWSDINMHEMYCAGHMTEAAVAYYNVTGKRKFLDVCERMAAHAMDTFGPEKRHWVPGHEEIELAMVKLYESTGKKEYLDFAYWLLEERGHGYGAYPEGSHWKPVYFQDDVPVRDMTEINGHAVRLMYLLCGMTDVAAYTGDEGYKAALDRVWDRLVNRNMYITGGIGASHSNEGFAGDYFLPNDDAYCETCASVGMVLWNWRMNQLTGDARYADVMERSLYNGAIAGISLDGSHFFYVNPLEADGTHHRQEWYGCACCPSQVCRFIPSIGNYIYGRSDSALWVNLFIGNTSDLCSITTGYPWNGHVEITLGPASKGKKAVHVRIPQWCESYTVSVNGEAVRPPVDKGYALLERNWKAGDIIILDLDMPVKVNAADPNVKADEGKRAVSRGPLVYCLEEADNPGIGEAVIAEDASFETEFAPGELGGIVKITEGSGNVFIPYFAWDNREAGRMKVWVDLIDNFSLLMSVSSKSNTNSGADKSGLVFDCDPGTDDAMALKLLAAGGFCPDWCVSTFGNMPWNYTNRNMNVLVRAFGLQSKMAVGAKAPYDGHDVSCGDFHGADGLADRTDSLFEELGMTQDDLDSNGSLKDLAEFICSKNDITYIALGPLATLSHLITDYPETVGHIKRVYVMGGGIEHFNKDGDKEYNFAGDGIAVKNVFDSQLDITLFPLDITELYAKVNPQQISSIKCPKQPFLKAFLLKNYESNFKIWKIDAAVLHDCLPALYLLYPDEFAVKDMMIAADSTGHIEPSGQGRLVHVAVSCPDGLVYEKLKEAVCGIIQPSSPTASH